MWIDMFPLIRQYYSVDCGMACLNMVCKFYHIDYNLEANEYQYFVSKNGVSLNSIVDMAKKHYFDVRCGRIQLKELLIRLYFHASYTGTKNIL
jgi:ATP-binding cassette subfamily B protein